jgi:hypothetical protein
MIVAIICGFALVGAFFIWSSRQKPKERSSLDPPLFVLTANGKYVIGFSLMFGAGCAALVFYLKGALL